MGNQQVCAVRAGSTQMGIRLIIVLATYNVFARKQTTGQHRLPPGRSLWMLCGRTLLLPKLTSHGNFAESGNFSCRKLPLVLRPVWPIVLKTKLRKRWNKNRKRGSSNFVVSSKISCDNDGPRTTKIKIAQRFGCISNGTNIRYCYYRTKIVDSAKKSTPMKSALHHS